MTGPDPYEAHLAHEVERRADLVDWTCDGQTDLLDDLDDDEDLHEHDEGPNPDDARDLTIDDDLLDGAT